MFILIHFPMEKQLNSFLGPHSKTPLVYIPFNWAYNQFVFCNIMQNSVTSIIVDSYETDKTHRQHSKPPLIMNIQICKERPQLFYDNSWPRPSKQFNLKISPRYGRADRCKKKRLKNEEEKASCQKSLLQEKFVLLLNSFPYW